MITAQSHRFDKAGTVDKDGISVEIDRHALLKDRVVDVNLGHFTTPIDVKVRRFVSDVVILPAEGDSSFGGWNP